MNLRFMIYLPVWCLAVMFWQAQALWASSPIELGARLELFLDDYLIERMQGVSFVLHQPQRAESVLRPEHPWEGSSLGHVTVFQDGEVMRMYYRGFIKPPGYSWESDQVMCYAESRDGIHWTKPALGLVEWNGSKANNIVWRGVEAGGMAPFVDMRPGCPTESRYKSLGGNPPSALGSPDGLRWRRLTDEPVLPKPRFGLSYWDVRKQKYVAYVRSRDAGQRGIALTESADFFTWSEPQNLQYGNAPTEQLYWNTAMPYFRAPHIYLGFPMRLNFQTAQSKDSQVDRTDCPLLFSRDGYHFDRRYMESFVRPGLDPNDWLPHANMLALGMVSTSDDEISMYLTNKTSPQESHLQRIVLRPDGFVSIHAPYSGGEFTTKPIRFSGDQLVLNASAGGAGSVQVEIQHLDGQPVPGFALKDCITYRGDSIAAPIQFTSSANLSQIAGQPVRLRIVMHDADLYSLQFCAARSNESNSQPASLWATASAKPINVGTRKQLFVDEKFVEQKFNVELVMNRPHPTGELLVTADQDYEAGGTVHLYSSVLKEANGTVRLWYDLFTPTGPGPYEHQRCVSYAESRDGLHFVKPNLGLYEKHGDKDNNVVLPGVIGGASVWIDPKAPAEHRYKTQAKVYPSGKFHMFSSPDGIRWSLWAEIDPQGATDTQTIVFWDDPTQRYLFFGRHKLRENEAPQGDVDARFRSVRRAEMLDLKKIQNTGLAIWPDKIDRSLYDSESGEPPVDYYGATVFRYSEAPDVMIMLAQAFWHWMPSSNGGYNAPGTRDVRLAISRDSKTFQRCGQWRPFISPGTEGRFDSRQIWVLPNPIVMGDEIWFYYAGLNYDRADRTDPAAPGGKRTGGIGRAVLRLDGFVSIDAPYEGGEFTTPPIVFEGNHLELNVDTCGGGSVRVELLSADGRPLPGFSGSASSWHLGNSVKLPVTWPSGELRTLAGQPVKLRFTMRDTKLYAFQFRDLPSSSESSGRVKPQFKSN